MAIECYYAACRFHSSQDPLDDSGPFCYEPECKAKPEEIEIFQATREEYLISIGHKK